MIQVPKKPKQTPVKKTPVKPADSSSSGSDSGVEADTKKTTPAVPVTKATPQKKKKQTADESSSSGSESGEPVVTKPIRSKQGNSLYRELS